MHVATGSFVPRLAPVKIGMNRLLYYKKYEASRERALTLSPLSHLPYLVSFLFSPIHTHTHKEDKHRSFAAKT